LINKRRNWDRAISKQSFCTAQRDRNYRQPERIDQIMLEERLNQICVSINVQIPPFLLLDFGDVFRKYLRSETVPSRRTSGFPLSPNLQPTI
jgi:hypothetical protein